MLRRIRALWQQFSPVPWDLDEQHLFKIAETIEIRYSNLQWEEQIRYSNRQHSEQKMGGLQGEIEFEGNLTPFIPLLNIAQVVHLGKETSFGLGKMMYQIL